jgi:hypothetical protein
LPELKLAKIAKAVQQLDILARSAAWKPLLPEKSPLFAQRSGRVEITRRNTPLALFRQGGDILERQCQGRTTWDGWTARLR